MIQLLKPGREAESVTFFQGNKLHLGKDGGWSYHSANDLSALNHILSEVYNHPEWPLPYFPHKE